MQVYAWDTVYGLCFELVRTDCMLVLVCSNWIFKKKKKSDRDYALTISHFQAISKLLLSTTVLNSKQRRLVQEGAKFVTRCFCEEKLRKGCEKSAHLVTKQLSWQHSL